MLHGRRLGLDRGRHATVSATHTESRGCHPHLATEARGEAEEDRAPGVLGTR